jgi:hypothetical protein
MFQSEEKPFKIMLGDQIYTGKVEFVIKKDKLALVFAWIEICVYDVKLTR